MMADAENGALSTKDDRDCDNRAGNSWVMHTLLRQGPEGLKNLVKFLLAAARAAGPAAYKCVRAAVQLCASCSIRVWRSDALKPVFRFFYTLVRVYPTLQACWSQRRLGLGFRVNLLDGRLRCDSHPFAPVLHTARGSARNFMHQHIYVAAAFTVSVG